MMPALTDKKTISLLKQLIEIPSVSSNETEIATFLEDYCKKIFSDAEVIRSENSTIVNINNHQDTSSVLMFCSHIDTVAPAKNWTKDPYKAIIEDDKVYGLGSNDALASGVSMLSALSTVSSENLKNCGFVLALVEEEESGSNGFARIEPSLNYTSAIFGEPTEMKMATEMRGYMRLKVLGDGKSCHASRPWEGQNAIFDMVHQLSRIEEIDLKDSSAWGQATIQPTLLSSGTTHNQIPDQAEAILDIRPTPEFNNDRILSLLDNNNIKYEIIHNRRNPMSCDPHSEIGKAIYDAIPHIESFAFGGTCDMAFATKPSIVMGPGRSVRSHAADEYILKSEISDAIEKYKKIIQSYIKLYN